MNYTKYTKYKTIEMHRMDTETLPLYNTEKESKRCYRMIDYSEPFFIVTFILGIIALIFNVIETQNFDVVVSVFMIVGSLIALWRVQKLGIAKKLMDSISNLKKENQSLKESILDIKHENIELKNTEKNLRLTESKLSNDVKNLRSIMQIVDTNNKNAEEIQQELFNLIEQYRKENERQEKNNKLSLFYTIDYNRDGKLTNEEVNEMKQVLKEEYGIDEALDENGDNTITRKELFKKLFHNKR